MSDRYYSDAFQCGDPAGLVGYLYDECEPGEREVIAAHVAMCTLCAEELASLGATRAQLAVWVPPESVSGFQITTTARTGETTGSEEAAGKGKVLRPVRPFDSAHSNRKRWWSEPLPAWAQVAAAVLLFASGMAIGVAGPGAPTKAAATLNTPPPSVTQPVVTAQPVASVSPRDLQDLERRLRGEIAQVRTAPVAAVASRTADPDLMKRVQALIADSEQRQRRELALRTTEIVRDMDTQRRVDMAQMQRTVGQIQDLTGAAVRDQNDMFNYLVKVSQRAR